MKTENLGTFSIYYLDIYFILVMLKRCCIILCELLIMLGLHLVPFIQFYEENYKPYGNKIQTMSAMTLIFLFLDVKVWV